MQPGKRIGKDLLPNVVEQVIAVVLFLYFVYRLWPDDVGAENAYRILLVVSESLVLILLVIRRPVGVISVRADDWFIAFAGTIMPLLVSPGGEPISPLGAALLLSFGLGVHLGAKLSLLRSFGLVAADRGVKRRGLYRFVRHPMYAGYMISHAGFLLGAPTLWNLGVYAAAWTLLIMRIGAEERVLRLNPEYRDYADGVRFRLLPGVF